MSDIKTKRFSAPLQSAVHLRGRARLATPIGWASLQNREQVSLKEELGSLLLELEDGASVEIELRSPLSSILIEREDRYSLGLFLSRAALCGMLRVVPLPLRWTRLRGVLLHDGDPIEVTGEVSRLGFTNTESSQRESAGQEVGAVRASYLISGGNASKSLMRASIEKSLYYSAIFATFPGHRVRLRGRAILDTPLGWLSLYRGSQPSIYIHQEGSFTLRLEDQTLVRVHVNDSEKSILAQERRTDDGWALRSSPVANWLAHRESTLNGSIFTMSGAYLQTGDLIYVLGQVTGVSDGGLSVDAIAIAAGVDACARLQSHIKRSA